MDEENIPTIPSTPNVMPQGDDDMPVPTVSGDDAEADAGMDESVEKSKKSEDGETGEDDDEEDDDDEDDDEE